MKKRVLEAERAADLAEMSKAIATLDRCFDEITRLRELVTLLRLHTNCLCDKCKPND